MCWRLGIILLCCFVARGTLWAIVLSPTNSRRRNSGALRACNTNRPIHVILKLSRIMHSNSRRREAARFLFAPNASSSRLRRWDKRQRSAARRPPAQRSSIASVCPALHAALLQVPTQAARAPCAARCTTSKGTPASRALPACTALLKFSTKQLVYSLPMHSTL